MRRKLNSRKRRLLEEKRVRNIMRLFEETMASDFDPSLEPGSEEYKDMVNKSYKDGVKRGDYTSASSLEMSPPKELSTTTKKALDKLETLLSGGGNKKTLVEDVLDLLNGALKSEEGRWALQQGTENDKFEGLEEGGAKEVGNGSPSQSNIFISKSIAFAMCSAPTALGQIKDTNSDKGYLKINIMTLPGDNFVILDGHHRWSQQFCFGKKTNKLDTRVFNFPDMDMEETLAKLQIGIAANTPADRDVPAWYSDAEGKDTRAPQDQAGQDGESPAEEDANAENKGPSDNLLKASKEGIIAKMHDLLNKVGTDIDPGIKNAADHTRFMGDDWTAQLSQDEAFKGWLNDKAALASYEKSPVKFGEKPGNELIKDGKIICPLREAIAQQCAEALSKTVCKKEIPTSAPNRDFMPQLDHAAALGDSGEKRLLNQLKQGKINHNPAITADAEAALAESIIRRWNKLAGTLLKD